MARASGDELTVDLEAQDTPAAFPFEIDAVPAPLPARGPRRDRPDARARGRDRGLRVGDDPAGLDADARLAALAQSAAPRVFSRGQAPDDRRGHRGGSGADAPIEAQPRRRSVDGVCAPPLCVPRQRRHPVGVVEASDVRGQQRRVQVTNDTLRPARLLGPRRDVRRERCQIPPTSERTLRSAGSSAVGRGCAATASGRPTQGLPRSRELPGAGAAGRCEANRRVRTRWEHADASMKLHRGANR